MTVTQRAFDNTMTIMRRRISSYLEQRHSSSADMKVRQSVKIGEIITALNVAGFRTLDAQAKALGLSRSTTWTLRQDNHKTSGLSVKIVCRILSKPQLLRTVRTIILEYIEEKASGYYGHSAPARRKFIKALAVFHQKQAKQLGMGRTVNPLRVIPSARPKETVRSSDPLNIAAKPVRSYRSR